MKVHRLKIDPLEFYKRLVEGGVQLPKSRELVDILVSSDTSTPEKIRRYRERYGGLILDTSPSPDVISNLPQHPHGYYIAVYAF